MANLKRYDALIELEVVVEATSEENARQRINHAIKQMAEKLPAENIFQKAFEIGTNIINVENLDKK